MNIYKHHKHLFSTPHSYRQMVGLLMASGEHLQFISFTGAWCHTTFVKFVVAVSQFVAAVSQALLQLSAAVAHGSIIQ